jgi:hypothetical protein
VQQSAPLAASGQRLVQSGRQHGGARRISAGSWS